MVVVELSLKRKKNCVPAIYFMKPSQQFAFFKKKIEESLKLLDSSKVTNKALLKLMERKGWRRLELLEKSFKRLDGASIRERKAVYNAFYRIFQRFQWAVESGTEREVELKVWLTSSLDYLCEFVGILEGRDDRNFKQVGSSGGFR